MFAIINNNGKQYKVTKDSTIKIDKLSAAANSEITFDNILLLNDGKKTTVGAPQVSGAKVVATVVENKKDPKIIVFKKKRRQNYRRKAGHRQEYTMVKIQEIKNS